MFEHILVPIDLSGRNKRALVTALGLARLSGARVTLLHVVHQIPRIPPGELRAFYQRLETAAKRKLDRTAKLFADAGVPAKAVVLLGEPAREIVRAAARGKVDVVVMGSHRVEPDRPGRGLGTISYKVGIVCPCPVLLVK